MTSGSYEIREITRPRLGTLFEGKVIYDRTYGHVTYGCAICCGYATGFVFTFNPLPIPLPGSAPNGVDGFSSCNGVSEDVSDYFWGGWSTANTGIATVNYYGTHTAVAVGSTNVLSTGSPPGTNQRTQCPPIARQVSGSDNVTPKIFLGGSSGTDITNKTTNVVVGQQIVLYASYGNASVNSQSWSVPGTTVGGFNSGSSNGGPTPTDFSQQSTTFYWVAAATSQQVTFTLNYVDNQNASQSAKATATFNIAGPTGVSVTTPLGNWQINSNTSGFELDFGFPISPDQGIQFNATATSPSGRAGTYEWVQLITADQTTATAGSSTLTCTVGTGVDSGFPYGTGLSVSDSPSITLPSADSKVTRSDSFTMYFMWRPGLTADIPVPLGNVSWQIYGDAVQSGGTWSVQSDSTKSANSFVPGTSWPTWTNTIAPGTKGTCH